MADPGPDFHAAFRTHDPVDFARSLRVAAAVCYPGGVIELRLSPELARAVVQAIDPVPSAGPAAPPEPEQGRAPDTAGIETPRDPRWMLARFFATLAVVVGPLALGAILGMAIVEISQAVQP